MGKERTPAQEQYFLLKKQHEDCLLFFRLGDFYELFYDDAHIAHKVLGITLTAKNKKSANPIPMAGVPFHAADKYIPQLINAGYKVAIAEQVGEVVPGKVVDREIVRIVTPATYEDEETGSSVLLAVWSSGNNMIHCAWWDFMTGKYTTKSVNDIDSCLDILERISPTEIVVALDFPDRENFLEKVWNCSLDPIWSYHDYPADYNAYIALITGTQSIDGFGSAVEDGRAVALATLFSYLETTQKQSLQWVHTISHERGGKTMRLDPITIKNLELVESSYEWSRKYALLWVIDRCKTVMGSDLLRHRLLHPWSQKDEIMLQQEAMHEWLAKGRNIKLTMNGFLKDCIAIPRLLTKILYRDVDALTIASMRDTLQAAIGDDSICWLLVTFWLSASQEEALRRLTQLLDSYLIDSEKMQSTRAIRDWFDGEVDRLRHIVHHGDKAMVDYFSSLQPLVKAATFKIKYITNQWYFFEVSRKDIWYIEKVTNLSDEKLAFIRRQSLKSSERYTTPHLDTLQEEYFSAKDTLVEREHNLLNELKQQIIESANQIHELSDTIARIDLYASMEHLVESNDWSLPEIGWERLSVVDWRHPVVEYFLDKNSEFIPNDCVLDTDQFFQLITGPNMGGKSTYLRQNALIVLLAHCGFPVPAKKASVPLMDALFARVWSGDVLAKNQSTFMTEMVEMAVIVNNATKDSFIILDELGRGTSTYDGLSLAKALSVYICQHIKAKTLFATHYHELITLEQSLYGFHNASVQVYESNDRVVFLKKIAPWWAGKSYGLDVARKAGIPQSIIQRAETYLAAMDSKELSIESAFTQAGLPFGDSNSHKNQSEILHRIKNILPDSLDTITPLEAMHIIQQIIEELGNDTSQEENT